MGITLRAHRAARNNAEGTLGYRENHRGKIGIQGITLREQKAAGNNAEGTAQGYRETVTLREHKAAWNNAEGTQDCRK